MRVVLDSNILVSALLFPGGTPETIYRMALEGRFELVTSAALLAELARVLGGEKFGADPRTVEAALAQLATISTIVDVKEQVAEIAADPSDNRVLETALAGDAEVIVSGDRHLLKLPNGGALESLTQLPSSMSLNSVPIVPFCGGGRTLFEPSECPEAPLT